MGNPIIEGLSISFSELFNSVFIVVPQLIVAIVVFLVGWVLAMVIGKLVASVIDKVKIDEALRGVGVEDALAKGGVRLNVGAFIGGLVKWFIIIAFAITALNVFQLTAVTDFLGAVATYIPNVIVAAIILVVSALVAGALERVVRASASATSMPSAPLLGGVTKWAVWVFGFLAAMNQLQIGVEVLNILLTGVVAMLAVAGGLAFGLGGKDQAGRFLDRLKRDITE